MLPEDTIVPPFSIFGGNPAVFMGEVTESMAQMNSEYAKAYYKNFIGVDNEKMQAASAQQQRPPPSSGQSQHSSRPSQQSRATTAQQQ